MARAREHLLASKSFVYKCSIANLADDTPDSSSTILILGHVYFGPRRFGYYFKCAMSCRVSAGRSVSPTRTAPCCGSDLVAGPVAGSLSAHSAMGRLGRQLASHRGSGHASPEEGLRATWCCSDACAWCSHWHESGTDRHGHYRHSPARVRSYTKSAAQPQVTAKF